MKNPKGHLLSIILFSLGCRGMEWGGLQCCMLFTGNDWLIDWLIKCCLMPYLKVFLIPCKKKFFYNYNFI